MNIEFFFQFYCYYYRYYDLLEFLLLRDFLMKAIKKRSLEMCVILETEVKLRET